MSTDLALLRLLQLVSPGLPVGMYSYSQGFERAIDDGWITDAETAGEWIAGLLENCLLRVDLPIAARLYDAWDRDDIDSVKKWSSILLAYRETSELRIEDKHIGQALARLLAGMEFVEASTWIRELNTTQAAMFTLAAVKWNIAKPAAMTGYLWSWLENQVLCAVKLVPLGQVAGQCLLHSLASKIPELLEKSAKLQDNEIGGSVFGLALASSRHEMQYSRLFRS